MPSMYRTLVIVVVAGTQSATTVHAEDHYVRALAASCASCHRTTQRVPTPLAGQPRAALVAKLRGFRDGLRPGTLMPQIAKGYTSDELDAIADYFAAQTPAR
jgi:cytochrome c553